MTKRDDLLWHYTDAFGLLGIIGTRERGCTLWASSVEYLNDREELTYGFQALGRALTRLSKEATKEGRAPLADTLDRFAQHYANGGGTKPSVYAASFCADGDLLSQWNLYSGGGGFAIGLDPTHLPRNYRSDPIELVTVRYGQDAVDACTSHLRTIIAGRDDIEFEEVWKVKAIMGGFKHPAFRAEQEHRLCLTDSSAVPHVRVRGGALLPYVEIPIPAEAVCRVRIGPTSDSDLQVRAAQNALLRAGLRVTLDHDQDGVLVDTSTAPYRAS